MPYTLEIERSKEYLQATVTGKQGGFEIGLKYLEQLGEICVQENYKKILIIDHLPGKISLNEIIAVIARLKDVGFQNVKIAFVDTKINQIIESTFKVALAAMSKMNGSIFSDVQEAKNWLMKD